MTESVGGQLIITAIPAIPLLAFFVLALFGRLLGHNAQYVGIFGATVSLVFSAVAFYVVASGGKAIDFAVEWIGLGGMGAFPMGIYIDGLAAMMLVVVSFVSLMVQLFSGGYMAGHKRFAWYYAVVSALTGSMLGLVVAPNFIEAYFFWELVGATSYLIHGFYFEKSAATYAAEKAFIVNRVADAALFVAIAIFWAQTGTTSFEGISQAAQAGFIGSTMLTVALLLVFVGATGKSAQFPLHVWLSNAMQGPTPLSALIHAAAMIVSGVYLVARTYDIFVQSPTAMEVVAIVGAFTAFMAATMAVVQKDIKQIIAYSTISQFGYVMLALGIGSFSAGVFHIYNHALFKALLFLIASSVGYAVAGSSWMPDMGGLKRRMPVTFWALVIAGLSLAGIFPFSGFWSKDAIIATAYAGGHYVLFVLALFTVFLTALYIFRGLFIAFLGEPKTEEARNAVEVPSIMTVPMIILAFLSIVSGWVGIPEGFGLPIKDLFGNFIQPSGFAQETLGATPHNFSFVMASISVLFGLAGIWLAYTLVVSRPQWATALGRTFPGTYAFLYRGWYFDAFYDRAFVRPAKALGRALREFDQRGLGRFVGGIGGAISWSGERLRVFQTGEVQNYALLIVMSVLVLGLIVGIGAGVAVMYLISGAGIVLAAAVALLTYRSRRAQ